MERSCGLGSSFIYELFLFLVVGNGCCVDGGVVCGFWYCGGGDDGVGSDCVIV